MDTLHEGAYAKINLTLDVLGKRADGFHDIQSVMQTISIRDDIEIDIGTGKHWNLVCSDDSIPADETNLAWKAAKVYCDSLKKDPDGITIRILKRIPAGAGLGGGSADAAAVLRALNHYYGSPLSIFALAELGAQVGSDVPFCVLMGTAMVEGKGERLRPLPAMPDCIFVVCKPDFSVSTPQLYQLLDSITVSAHPDNRLMERMLAEGNLQGIADTVYNVFDPIVTGEHLELNYIKSIFNSYGSLGQQMTGSGSAVFAIMPNFEYAAVVCNMLKDNYSGIYIARPVYGIT